MAYRDARTGALGLALLCLLGTACSGRDQPAAVGPSEATHDVPRAPSRPGPYVAHEWGLVAASVEQAEVRALAGPEGADERAFLGLGRSRDGVGVGIGSSFGAGHRGGGKPIIYFHLDDGTDTLPVRVAVRPAGGGHVVEHFPDGQLSEDGAVLRWPEVRVTRGACHGRYPNRADARCQTEDHHCELPELAAYETDDADCVHVGEAQAGLLFYRTGPARAELPLRVVREDAGNLRVRPREGAPAVSGWVMRIRRGPNLLSTLVRVVSLDGVGEQGVVLAPAEGDGVVVANEALAMVQDALVAAGLTTPERDAFVAAWSDALFGALTRSDAQPEIGGVRSTPGVAESGASAGVRGGASTAGVRGMGLIGGAQEPPRHPLGSVADAVVYVLPQASVDALIPLELEPAPRELRRVFLARVDASGPRPPGLRAALPEVRGALPVEVVRRFVRRHFSQLRRCLADNRETTSFQLELRVLTTGAVSQATVEGEHLSDDERSCLLGVARRLSFPASETLNTITQRMTLQR